MRTLRFYDKVGLLAPSCHTLAIENRVMNYLPGVLAKEVATLSLLSNGRFEPGIGAGDYFQEARAWGTPVPRAPQRISGLRETIQALRRIWQGEVVTFEGEHLHLKDAAVTPTPPAIPHVVVGAGSSRSLIQSAIDFADEINVYADDELIHFAHQTIAAAPRPVALSVFVWDRLDDIEERLLAWEKLGVARTFVTCWHPFDKLPPLAKLL